MNGNTRRLTRIALFAALAYVLSWVCVPLPNVNLIFFVIFSAGLMWGSVSGAVVGIVGMGLWTGFNPFGPAAWPIMMAQVGGAALGGVIGGLFGRLGFHQVERRRVTVYLVVAALLCTVAYYLPVSLVDALVFRPFWPRLIGGMVLSLVSLLANAVVFPLLFFATRRLYERERVQSWSHG